MGTRELGNYPLSIEGEFPFPFPMQAGTVTQETSRLQDSHKPYRV